MQNYSGNTTGLSGRPTVTVSEPVGTDVRNSQSIRTPVEKLADLLQYLMTNAALKVMDAILDLGNFRIQNVANPVNAQDAATKAHVDAKVFARSNLPTVGQQISTSCGFNAGVTGTSYTDVTNLSVTITTSGRPVLLILQPDGSGNGASVWPSSGVTLQLRMMRGATEIGAWQFQFASNTGAMPASLHLLDAPAAGTYTYKIQGKNVSAGTSYVNYLALAVFEL